MINPTQSVSESVLCRHCTLSSLFSFVKSLANPFISRGKTKTNGKATTTPRKRGRKTATDKANGDGDGEGEDESPTKKQRTPAKGSKGAASGEKAKVGARAMPTSYENASPEDRMLLRMKDEENKSWGEIRQAWEEMTGEKVGGSTLCGRYGRIKANFVVFTPEDVRLITP